MAAAPRDPPPALVAAYTLQHQVPLERFYVDDASSMAGTTTRFSREEIAGYVLSAERDLRDHQRGGVELLQLVADTAARRRSAHGGVARHLVTHALAADGAAAADGLDVLVFGAVEPWLECLCLAAGAKSVTTVEYQRLEYEHKQLRTLGAAEFVEAVAPGGRLEGRFDLAVSLSSFDHDGLGRYRPLDP